MTDTPEGPVWKPPPGGGGPGGPPSSAPGRPLPPPGSAPIVPAAPPTRPLTPRGDTPAEGLSSGLSGTLQGFLWAVCGLSVVSTLLVIGNLLAFNTWWDTPVGSREAVDALDDWARVEDALQAAGALTGVVGIIVFVLLVIWAHAAHRASGALWQGERTWSSGWSVGGWFVPLANAVIPKLVLNEVERIAFAPRVDGRVRDDVRSRPTAAVGWVWWLATIAGAVLNLVGNALGGEPDSSAAEVRVGYVFNSVGLTLTAVGTAAGAVFVGRLSSRLTGPGLRRQP